MSFHKGASGNATVFGQYMMLSFCAGLSPQLLNADPGVITHNDNSVGGHWQASLALD